MNKLKILFLTLSLFLCGHSFAQYNTDGMYRKSLKEVLIDIQKRFDIKIKYADSMVEGKLVNYAEWRYRNDVDQTLENVLSPLDMKVKKEKDKQYKLSYYEYYRWDPKEGWAELDRIASQYKNLQEWEQRKAVLKPCLMEELQLAPLPASPNSKPIIAGKRKFDGYNVENIAIEILPGVYVNGSLYKPAIIKAKFRSS